MPNPAATEILLFREQWRVIEAEILDYILAEIKSGKNIDTVLNSAFRELDIDNRLKNIITGLAIRGTVSAGLEIIDKAKYENFVLNTVWPDGTVSLGQKLTQKQVKNDIIASLKISIKNNKAWNTTAKALTDKQLVSGDIAKHMKELIKLSRKQNLTKEDKVAYQRAVRKSQREIDKLSANDAPTTRLKKAYQRVLNATEAGATEALDRSIISAVKAKGRFRAETIARTELVRNRIAAEQYIIDNDDDVVAWKSILSSRHKVIDQCDAWAKMNLYGLGPGVFPKSVPVSIPYHPNCLCFIKKIYRSEIEEPKLDIKQGAKWLKENPAQRRVMMTRENEEKFLKNPNQWQKYITGWDGLIENTPRLKSNVVIMN
jgi:hypothetical protein